MTETNSSVILPPVNGEQEQPLEPVTPYERLRLGGDEFAICGVIDLAPVLEGGQPAARVVMLDVGFRGQEGSYGPYDVDASGEKRTFKKPYVLVTQVDTPDGKVTKTFEMDENEPVLLGRETPSNLALGLEHDHISRKHATVTVEHNGTIDVQDNQSMNGTEFYRPGKIVKAGGTSYGYTTQIADVLHKAGTGRYVRSAEEVYGRGYGEYAGRPIIARDTEINGGVYPVGHTEGEAIVVDDKKYPEELDKVYADVQAKLDEVTSAVVAKRSIKSLLRNKHTEMPADNQARILESVFSVVSETLRYDLEATNAISNPGEKIALNAYIDNGVGVCRTQALLSAYIVERLIKDGKLEGKISIDRNMNHEGVPGGHAWARFLDSNGEVYIIDPAQQFVGTLSEAQASEGKWDYRRSEDLVKEIFSKGKATLQ